MISQPNPTVLLFAEQIGCYKLSKQGKNDNRIEHFIYALYGTTKFLSGLA
ncbi:hypothetical protein TC41_2383 [Alicyclobacillus acidocaldarius subsp. acidocaldarius Tc-4-1]|uniref:Uncharacterized protein n=1 Tax=Alicyclobacillus acidocaldarius (strain Tc-4-1) TaxID=1048834 RepID=F8IGK4_ALIAT|nr:hypothetical protein TC41_2383 [Alicyclobacillus acidocaldarius subsp. acidocaldarius Tc-4-1]